MSRSKTFLHSLGRFRSLATGYERPKPVSRSKQKLADSDHRFSGSPGGLAEALQPCALANLFGQSTFDLRPSAEVEHGNETVYQR